MGAAVLRQRQAGAQVGGPAAQRGRSELGDLVWGRHRVPKPLHPAPGGLARAPRWGLARAHRWCQGRTGAAPVGRALPPTYRHSCMSPKPLSSFNMSPVPCSSTGQAVGWGHGVTHRDPPAVPTRGASPATDARGRFAAPQFTPRGARIIPRGGPGSPFVPSVPVPSMLTLRWLPAAYSGWRRSRPKNARCPS